VAKNSKWLLPILVLSLAALVALASNAAFRIPFTLFGPPDSVTGENWISLPYRPKPGLTTAADLFEDIGGAAVVASIGRLNPMTDAIQAYTGDAEDDFPLQAGEGLVVVMKSTVAYEFVGSHVPKLPIHLPGPDDSATGTSLFATPYHTTATNAASLLDQLGRARVMSVERLNRATGSIERYASSTGGANFTLVPGESYRIQTTYRLDHVPRTR
jgi:hypothetical protein